MFEHRPSQIVKDIRETDLENNQGNAAPMFDTESGAGVIDQSVFHKSEDSTPDYNSSDDSQNDKQSRNSPPNKPDKPQQTKPSFSEAESDPASVHFQGHATNPSGSDASGPLTTSLSANGEIDQSQPNGEAEDALISKPSVHDKANIPALDQPDSNKDPRPKGSRSFDDETYTGQLLGPMEPMKFAKTIRSDTHQHKPRLLPAEHFTGFPSHDPGISTPGISNPTQSVPSISEDARLTNIINQPNGYRNLLNETYTQPANAPQSLVLLNPNSHPEYVSRAPSVYSYEYPDHRSEYVYNPSAPAPFVPHHQEEYKGHPHFSTSAYPVLFGPLSPPIPGTQPNQMEAVPVPVPVPMEAVQLEPVQLEPAPLEPSTMDTAHLMNGGDVHTHRPKPKDKKESGTRAIPPTNTQGRIFKCTHPGCDWSFARSSDQKRHIRSHEKPSLKCPFWELEPNCNRKGAMFYRLDVLKRHLRLVHLQRPNDGVSDGGLCRICHSEFNSTRDFLNHCESCAKSALAFKKDTTAPVPVNE